MSTQSRDTLLPGPPRYVCFSGQDWWYHNRAHSDFQLMRRMAVERDVIFINSIGMRMPLPGRSTEPVKRILRKVLSIGRFVQRPLPETPRFVVVTPLVVPLYQWAFARTVNAHLVRLQLRIFLRRFGKGPPVYLVTIPTAWDVVKGMGRRRLIYNRSDKQSAFAETDQGVIRNLEDELLQYADRVLYVSHQLMEEELPKTGDRSFFLDHGVDAKHFTRVSDREIPADLRAIPGPRIGFFGGIDDYVVDLDLIAHIARRLPYVHVVLIGKSTCSLERFARIPNIHCLGFRPYEQIPAYGSGFDVGLMPWLANDWIEHSNPIKLKEYLALGLSVVSTEFPEAKYFEQHLRVAKDPDEIVEQIVIALKERDFPSSELARLRAERRHAVASVSWESRVELLRDLAEGTEK